MGVRPSRQWAAVRIHSGATTEPPQKWEMPDRKLRRETCDATVYTASLD